MGHQRRSGYGPEERISFRVKELHSGQTGRRHHQVSTAGLLCQTWRGRRDRLLQRRIRRHSKRAKWITSGLLEEWNRAARQRNQQSTAPAEVGGRRSRLRALRFVLLAALFADAIDLKRVAGRKVVIFAADLLLQLADFRGEELDGTAAVCANHVVMTATVVLMFVAGNTIVEGDFAGEPAFCE